MSRDSGVDHSVEVFRLFDPHNTGQIEEQHFRKILSSKEGITEEDIEEMVGGNTITITITIVKVNYRFGSRVFPVDVNSICSIREAIDLLVY